MSDTTMRAAERMAEGATGDLEARVERLTEALRSGDEETVLGDLVAELGGRRCLELGGAEVDDWPIVMGHTKALKAAERSTEKAWTATVCYDPAAPGGLRREFWGRGGERGMLRVPDGLAAGDVVEVALDSTDRRGRKSQDRDYYRVLAATDDSLVMAKASKPGARKPAEVGALVAKVLRAYIAWVAEAPERAAARAAKEAEAAALAADIAAVKAGDVGPLAYGVVAVRRGGVIGTLDKYHGYPLGSVRYDMMVRDERGRATGLRPGVVAQGARVVGERIDPEYRDGDPIPDACLLVPMGERMARALGLETRPMPADPAAELRAEVARLEREAQAARAAADAADAALAAARERLAGLL